MKAEVKKIDATKRELKLEVPRERVTKKLDQVYGDISKEAKIKGFRPGKAPRHVIESHYGKAAQEETVKQLIPEIYREAVVQEKLDPIDLPEILDIVFKDGMISFTAKLDVRPEVKIEDYKGIKVKRENSQVTDEDLTRAFEFIRKGQGEGKEITVDDAFARGLGYPSLEDFKTSLRRQMEIDKDRHNRTAVEHQIIEHLFKQAQFALPQSVVQKQLEHLVTEAKERLHHQGVKEEDVQKQEENIRKELSGQAQRDIKVYFIMDKIAELEKISLEKNENIYHKVMGFLLKEANWSNEGTA